MLIAINNINVYADYFVSCMQIAQTFLLTFNASLNLRKFINETQYNTIHASMHNTEQKAVRITRKSMYRLTNEGKYGD